MLRDWRKVRTRLRSPLRLWLRISRGGSIEGIRRWVGGIDRGNCSFCVLVLATLAGGEEGHFVAVAGGGCSVVVGGVGAALLLRLPELYRYICFPSTYDLGHR
jgi:hypothetical protein